MTLRKDQDYSVDASSGIISFTSALGEDVIARVTYTLVPGKSRKSTEGLKVPVTLNVFRVKARACNSRVSCARRMRTRVGERPCWACPGMKKWSAVNLTSQFLVSQATGSAPNADFWQRSAFKLGEDSAFGALKFSGSFLHSGQDFSGASDPALASGHDVTNLAAVYSPTKTVQAAIKFQDSSTSGQTNGGYSRLRSGERGDCSQHCHEGLDGSLGHRRGRLAFLRDHHRSRSDELGAKTSARKQRPRSVWRIPARIHRERPTTCRPSSLRSRPALCQR